MGLGRLDQDLAFRPHGMARDVLGVDVDTANVEVGVAESTGVVVDVGRAVRRAARRAVDATGPVTACECVRMFPCSEGEWDSQKVKLMMMFSGPKN